MTASAAQVEPGAAGANPGQGPPVRVVVLTARPGRVACELDGAGPGESARELAMETLR